jgi:hypothetical protein
METDKVNRMLTLAANAGVLFGLILVAFQINQNTELTRVHITNDYYLADMELELAMMGDDPAGSWIKAVYAPDYLTEKDMAILDRYFNYGLVQVQRLQKMNELGFADHEWEERIDYLGWQFGNEVGRRWWAYSKEGFPDDFIQTVDEILARNDHTGNRVLLDAMRPKPKSEQ